MKGPLFPSAIKNVKKQGKLRKKTKNHEENIKLNTGFLPLLIWLNG